MSSTVSRASVKSGSDSENSDSSTYRKKDLKKKLPTKVRSSSSSGEESADKSKKKELIETPNKIDTVEKSENVHDEKTIPTSDTKKDKSTFLKSLVKKKENKSKSAIKTTSVNKSAKEAEEDNKEIKENKSSWERSTRIDRKISDIFYISGLYGTTEVASTENPTPAKKRSKKRKSKSSNKKAVRSVSAKISSDNAHEKKSSIKNDDRNRKSSYSDDYEDRSKSVSSENKIDKKTIKNKRNSVSSIQSHDNSPVRKPPYLYPDSKIENSENERSKNDSRDADRKTSTEKVSKRTHYIAREMVECDVYREYRPKLDSHDIAHHFFHRENEQTYFVRSLKKDM